MNSRKVIGSYEDEGIEEVVLSSNQGVSVSILSYGAVIRDWRVPVGGQPRPVTLGFDTFDPYPEHSPYFGAVVGRVANRTGGSAFRLDGKNVRLVPNEGENHLHGGPRGFGKRNWRVAEYNGTSVKLTLFSADGEMGYPGDLDVELTYTLAGHRLDIAIEARASRTTPVNIVQHNYFNLMGEGDICGHTLQLAANAYTPVDDAQIPTGAIEPVEGTELDFRTARTLHNDRGNGAIVDHNFVLDTRKSFDDPAAVLKAPDNSLSLKLFTDQPGLQVYTGWKLDVPVPGIGGRSYPKFAGICLEDQLFPDAMNNPHFPSPIVTPDRPYRHKCAIEIA